MTNSYVAGPVRSAEVAALLGKKTTALGPTRDGLRWIPDLRTLGER